MNSAQTQRRSRRNRAENPTRSSEQLKSEGVWILTSPFCREATAKCREENLASVRR